MNQAAIERVRPSVIWAAELGRVPVAAYHFMTTMQADIDEGCDSARARTTDDDPYAVDGFGEVVAWMSQTI
jgi:hypothetical protein